MKINSGIGTGLGHYDTFQFKILEVMVFNISHIINVRPWSGYIQQTIFYKKRFSIFTYFPSIQVLTVENGYPSILICFCTGLGHCAARKMNACQKQKQEEESVSHSN